MDRCSGERLLSCNVIPLLPLSFIFFRVFIAIPLLARFPNPLATSKRKWVGEPDYPSPPFKHHLHIFCVFLCGCNAIPPPSLNIIFLVFFCVLDLLDHLRHWQPASVWNKEKVQVGVSSDAIWSFLTQSNIFYSIALQRSLYAFVCFLQIQHTL